MTTQDIEELQTIDSMYGTGKINAYIDGELYRIEITELLKMLQHVPLEVTMKRKYKYLTIAKQVKSELLANGEHDKLNEEDYITVTGQE